MRDVVITGYVRTPFSQCRPNDLSKDWLGAWRADELLAGLIPELVRRSGIPPESVDDFIVGSAMGVSEQWTFGGRSPVYLANLPATVAAKFIDQQCGSGMAAVQTGFMEVACGAAEVVIAAGMEHMGRVPIGPTLFENGTIQYNQRLYTDPVYADWDMNVSLNMGLTAEKLADKTGVTREEMDAWTLRSHERAHGAWESGFFHTEVMPVPGKDGAEGVSRDQSVRAAIDPEKLAGLKAIFRENGVITAGNSSPLNAGAAAMTLMNRNAAEEAGIPALARIRSIGFAGVDPTLMGEGPVPAVEKALKMAELRAEDIDFWEINEAFSVVVHHCMRHFGIEPEKVNVRGGALAIGHPMGATGIRLTGTLARILGETCGRYGCATACIGGGQGIAVIIERLSPDPECR